MITVDLEDVWTRARAWAEERGLQAGVQTPPL